MITDWKEMLKSKEAGREGVGAMRLANRGDVNDILRLFYDEGWIEFGQDDLEFLLDSSPATCFKNVYEDKLVGVIFATETPEQISYPNSRLLDRRYRKQIQHHEEGAKFLDYVGHRAKLEIIYSAPRLAEKYNGAYGFQTLVDYRRFVLNSDDVQLDPAGAKEITADDVADVAEFAKAIYHCSRDHLINHFLVCGARGFVSRDEAGRVDAFTMVRSLPRARALGPLLAHNDAAAARVLAAAARALPGETWQIDAGEARFKEFMNTLGVPVEAGEMGMVKMYRGDPTLIENEAHIYSIFSHYIS